MNTLQATTDLPVNDPKNPILRDGLSSKPGQRVVGSAFSPHLVLFILMRRSLTKGELRENRRHHLGLTSTLALVEKWREKLLMNASDLSLGSEALRQLSVSAADVSPAHADGRICGVALALPAHLTPKRRAELVRAAARVCTQNQTLILGPLSEWEVHPCIPGQPTEPLRSTTWTAHPDGSPRWSTVTPIALDQRPRANRKNENLAEATAMIQEACTRVGLPQPREIVLTQVSAQLGTPSAQAFPKIRRKDGTPYRLTHAILVFNEPVVGPILLGTGTNLGYGLCRPLEVEA